MAMMAKDGTRHHSASRARMHDELSTSKGSATEIPMRKPGAGEKDAGQGPKHPQPSTTPITDHVDEHGPAHAVHHEFDKGSNLHHVSSFHGDAKPGENDHPGAHHSQHKTHAAAHQHMGKSMGLDHEAEDRPEEEGDETPDSTEDQETGKHAIPGLA